MIVLFSPLHFFHFQIISNPDTLNSYHALFLPGGRCYEFLSVSYDTLELIRSFRYTGRFIFSLGSGILTLFSADILSDVRISTYPNLSEMIQHSRSLRQLKGPSSKNKKKKNKKKREEGKEEDEDQQEQAIAESKSPPSPSSSSSSSSTNFNQTLPPVSFDQGILTSPFLSSFFLSQIAHHILQLSFASSSSSLNNNPHTRQKRILLIVGDGFETLTGFPLLLILQSICAFDPNTHQAHPLLAVDIVSANPPSRGGGVSGEQVSGIVRDSDPLVAYQSYVESIGDDITTNLSLEELMENQNVYDGVIITGGRTYESIISNPTIQAFLHYFYHQAPILEGSTHKVLGLMSYAPLSVLPLLTGRVLTASPPLKHILSLSHIHFIEPQPITMAVTHFPSKEEEEEGERKRKNNYR